MKIFQLLIFCLIFILLASCKKEKRKDCYKVTTISEACQGIAVQFSDKTVKDQNGTIVPGIIELINVPTEFHEKGSVFYTRFIYDEEINDTPVACPQVYGGYKIYVCEYVSKSSCEGMQSNNEKN